MAAIIDGGPCTKYEKSGEDYVKRKGFKFLEVSDDETDIIHYINMNHVESFMTFSGIWSWGEDKSFWCKHKNQKPQNLIHIGLCDGINKDQFIMLYYADEEIRDSVMNEIMHMLNEYYDEVL